MVTPADPERELEAEEVEFSVAEVVLLLRTEVDGDEIGVDVGAGVALVVESPAVVVVAAVDEAVVIETTAVPV